MRAARAASDGRRAARTHREYCLPLHLQVCAVPGKRHIKPPSNATLIPQATVSNRIDRMGWNEMGAATIHIHIHIHTLIHLMRRNRPKSSAHYAHAAALIA